MGGTDQPGGVDERWAALRADARSAMPAAATAAPIRAGGGEGRGRWRRTRRWVRGGVAVTVVAAGAFAAGWVTGIGGLDVLSSSISAQRPSPAPAAAPVAADEPAAAEPAASERSARPTSYTYEITGNYPVSISYLDGHGEDVHLSRTDAPWTLEVPTADWGEDAEPRLLVMSVSDRGDARVSCRVIDSSDQVIASDDTAEANAAASCWVF